MTYKPADKKLNIYGTIYPDKIHGTDKSMLYYCIRRGEKQIKFSTGERIENKYLKGSIIIDTSKRDVLEDNLKEKLIRIVDYFNDKALKHQLLSLKEIKELYNNEERTDSSVGVFKYWMNYIQSKAFVPNEIRENKKYKKYNDDINNRLIIDRTTHSKLINTYRRLKIFLDNNYKNFDLNERDITNEFIDKYINVYKFEKYAISTINKDISNIKAYMNWLIQKSLINSWNSNSIHFHPDSEETAITITEDEIHTIGNLDLKDKNKYNKNYEVAINLMVFGFYTGLRVNDILRQDFSKFDLSKDIFTVRSQKDNRNVKIINNYKIRKIIEYFKDNGNPKIHVNTYNKYIKLIFEECNIDNEVSVKRNKSKETFEPKYKVASSHIFRKSFITEATNNGMNLNVLAKLTGKKYKDVFYQYLKLNDIDLINEYNKVFTLSNKEYDNN